MATKKSNTHYPHALAPFFFQTERYFYGSLSREHYHFCEGADAYITGIEYENLAPFFLRNPISTISRFFNIVDQAVLLYQKNKLFWMMIVSERLLNSDLRKALNLKKLVFLEKSVAMVYDCTEIQKNIIHKTRSNIIKNIKLINANNLQDWVVPLVQAFDSTMAIMTQYGQAHQYALQKKAQFYHFVLYEGKENDSPVSCLTLSIEENRARIDDVGTIPASQRKGYATYLIQYALEFAKQKGVAYCFLESSEKSLSVYEKIGFSTIFKNSIYEYRG